MKKLTIALIVAFVVAAVAIIFFTPYDRPAKAEVEAGINPSQMMANVKDLPVAHQDYSVVFNFPPAL